MSRVMRRFQAQRTRCHTTRPTQGHRLARQERVGLLEGEREGYGAGEAGRVARKRRRCREVQGRDEVESTSAQLCPIPLREVQRRGKGGLGDSRRLSPRRAAMALGMEGRGGIEAELRLQVVEGKEVKGQTRREKPLGAHAV